MTAVLDRPERQVIVNATWETFERLLADAGECRGTRFTFDQGVLEITMPSQKHETLIKTIEMVIDALIDELELDFFGTRSTTFKRPDLEKGFEADSSYYFENADQVDGKEKIDLTKDPPPDLIIEVDVTNDSLNKLPIYAAVGTPEVWRYVNSALTILELRDSAYVPSPTSRAFPKVTNAALTEIVALRNELSGKLWLRRVHSWARSL